MPKKNRNKEKADTSVRNASPVCYINSDELRPEYIEDPNERKDKKENK